MRWQGQVEAALAHLQTLRPGPDCEPIEALEEALTYLKNQREWIGNYHQWQEAGYPVGSGLVERERHGRGGSACTSAQCPVECCVCQKVGGCLAPLLWWNLAE